MAKNDKKVEVTDILLEKLMVKACAEFPMDLVENAECKITPDLIHNSLIVELKKAIWAEKLGEEYAVIRYPNGPWQWIKSWLKERCGLFKHLKVEYKVHEVRLTKYAAYPKLALELPDASQYVIRYTKQEDKWTETKS